VAHDKHVLSMKDNNQSENLRDLVDAGIRSFKIEGRYKDMAYVKNITAHYRKLFDEVLNERQNSSNPLAAASHGRTTFSFEPDPNQNFNREFTDYFVQGRKEDIGAFDTPKNPGQPIGWVSKVTAEHVEITIDNPTTELHNGDGLCYYDLQKQLVGLQINRAEAAKAKGVWKLFPKDPMEGFKDLRQGVQVNRNRDMSWVRTLDKKSAERRMGVWMQFAETANGQGEGLQLTLTDEAGHTGTAQLAIAWQAPKEATQAQDKLKTALGKLGDTLFEPLDVQVALPRPWFVPPSQLNALRRDAVHALEDARAQGLHRLPRAVPMEPPVAYPEDTLSYLANVFNQKARDFYAKHGVKVIDAAYESQEELGEVSLMITKHCVRFSLSLCPKQAKGVTGVQGTVKAEPMQLINGKEKLTLRFDCKPCEMHVVGKIKKSVLNAVPESPVQFYKTRPVVGLH
jgi:putative protease